MKNTISLVVIAVIMFVTGALLFITSPAKSPQQIYPANKGPGSGHSFGYDISYTVVRHATLDGKKLAVISSREKGVEIWSPIPDLVDLPAGSTFQLSEAESWNKSFKVLKRGT